MKPVNLEAPSTLRVSSSSVTTSKTFSTPAQKKDTISEDKTSSSKSGFFASIGKICSGFWRLLSNCLCFCFKGKEKATVEETITPSKSAVKITEPKTKTEKKKQLNLRKVLL